MDIASIVGLVFGFLAIVISISIDDGPGALLAFVNMPSVFITVGGGLAATMISYKLADFIRMMKICANIFSAKESSKEDMIRTLVDLSNKARREGLLALEAEQDKIGDDFVKQSLQLVVDGVEPGTIRESMELELANLEGRHSIGRSIFKTMAAQFPAWGMIGTLIGLINLLGSLDDPSAVGPAMAVALITTFYGSILANYVCNPVAEKLGMKSKNEIQVKEMIIEGILSIQAGENPRIMEHKLKTFLSPDQKARYDEMANGGAAAAGAGQPQEAA
ncbi:MAG: motility protein A [Clostridiales bacterium]|jgi:chemotaxis protein MotA|nr:motility protein A [Clostridiales bacterium]